ncbi:MAG: hypothetical protein LQ337_008360 [Flavoplaca oasis]|nr:MAG: hypothetical protein LQ337_008360 [Flavoplaca oasis]
MHIGDLTIVFTRYGRFAVEAQWREIREALNDFRRRFLYDDAIRLPPPRFESYKYVSDVVELDIRGYPEHLPGPSYLSGKEVAQVLNTINGLFFNPEEKPREITIQIEKSDVGPTFMVITWQKLHNPWPQVPFNVPAGSNLMEVYTYGRDFDPNRSFNKRVSHDMDAIYDEINKEIDESTKPIKKNAYISGIVKLTIDPPTQAGQAVITALETDFVLMYMKNLIFLREYGPREFGTYIRNPRGQTLAKVSLLIDPDGFDDQPVLTLPSPNW